MKRSSFGEYIRFMDKTGQFIPGRAFQNYFVNQVRTYSGASYAFAPFGVSGTTSKRGGATSSGGLVSIPNDLTVSMFTEAILSGWLVEIKTVLMTLTEGVDPVEQLTIITQFWSCNGGPQDVNKTVISLKNPLDAVEQQVPKGILSSSRVGNLPPSGNILSA
jgi:hypothetical protein